MEDDALLVNRTVEFLQEEAPEELQGLSLDLVMRLVSNGIERARSHGLTQESAIQDFVLLMFEVAPNFDQHPAFAKALRDTADQGIDEDARIHSILERVTVEEWNQAAEGYDENAWGVVVEED
jgi:hypothetical protein